MVPKIKNKWLRRSILLFCTPWLILLIAFACLFDSIYECGLTITEYLSTEFAKAFKDSWEG